MKAICPLCQLDKHMRKEKILYGVPVCKKCYYRFTNRRQLAYIVDALIWWPISVLLLASLGALLEIAKTSEDVMTILIIISSWLILPLIFFCKDGMAGYSPGKWITGVRVVHHKTFEPIGPVTALKRNLPLLIPIVPLVIAFQLAKGYRWGDRWARSKVIWKKYADHPVFTGLLACENCQYNLTGNVSGQCPECGMVISSANQDRLAETALQMDVGSFAADGSSRKSVN